MGNCPSLGLGLGGMFVVGSSDALPRRDLFHPRQQHVSLTSCRSLLGLPDPLLFSKSGRSRLGIPPHTRQREPFLISEVDPAAEAFQSCVT